MERGNLLIDVKGKSRERQPRKGESTEAIDRVLITHSSDEAPVMGVERRGYIVQ